MSKAEELAARARAAVNKRAALSHGDKVPRSASADVAPNTKSPRSTVDLPPNRDRDLKQWQLEAAQQLGKGRVTRQDVLAGLVGLLLTDANVQARLINYLLAEDER
ncbi:hypothetical protein [Actinokineospora sp. NBRC 105648]|uniref:hypothetical protein n=1 Tax=Actinokineospora sp. NBRC 105648 TaxID=3032206 RepID=UPI00249F9A1F|nr:hypothetical protein [Actinokineospora sp. NBRC 105648]GLZ43714.1 hypothetical protein Acsp05_73380 [Actinokineospora sp. NBRC 105648]